MSENPNPNGPEDQQPDVIAGDGDPNPSIGDPIKDSFKPITSQEDFDAAIQKRLARERSKYEGFDELKEKATKYDEWEAEQGDAIEKAQRRAEKAERDAAAWKTKHEEKERAELVRDIADELELPKGLRKRVQGKTEEEIRADIADLMDGLPKPKKDDEKEKVKDDDKEKSPPTRTPRPRMTFSGTGDESDEGLTQSADDILKEITRGGVGAR